MRNSKPLASIVEAEQVKGVPCEYCHGSWVVMEVFEEAGAGFRVARIDVRPECQVSDALQDRSQYGLWRSGNGDSSNSGL
jgi:hypothetical protein